MSNITESPEIVHAFGIFTDNSGLSGVVRQALGGTRDVLVAFGSGAAEGLGIIVGALFGVF